MCVEDSMVTALGLQANITDCLNYRIDKDGTLKCTECGNGKSVQLNGTCSATVCT